MIPKMIHYCWFGGNPQDATIKKCIASWEKYFPDYQIIQWNESNFDIGQIPFMKDAYAAGKWAFVSDVARLLILYQYGGIYFDTDVEVIKSFEDIVHEDTEGFVGMERTGEVSTGLVLGIRAAHPLIQRNIEIYKHIDFKEYESHLSDIACPMLTTKIFAEEGFDQTDAKCRQKVCGLDIYPARYFAPMDYMTGKLSLKKETHSIHWFSASWQDAAAKREQEVMRRMRRIFGTNLGESVYGVWSHIKKDGLIEYGKYQWNKRFRGSKCIHIE